VRHVRVLLRMRAPKTSHDDSPRPSLRAERAGRRASAIALLKADLSLAEVARRVGVSREAVRQWRKALDEGGPEKLIAPAQGVGRPTRLTEAQQRQLVACLMRPASARGFAAEEWNTRRVLAIIELDFGVTFSVAGLRLLLDRFGFALDEDGAWRPRGPDSQKRGEGKRSSDASSMARRAAVVARYMQSSGYELGDIAALLRQAGVKSNGRPISREGVDALLKGARRRRSRD